MELGMPMVAAPSQQMLWEQKGTLGGGQGQFVAQLLLPEASSYIPTGLRSLSEGRQKAQSSLASVHLFKGSEFRRSSSSSPSSSELS